MAAMTALVVATAAVKSGRGVVLGWLLVAVGSPRLRVEVGSALLLTPVGALLLAAVVLGSACLTTASSQRRARRTDG